MPIGMIIEIVVAILLVITIGYCWTLNSRLKRLRADEASLRATISELITATEIAERAILGLKSTAGNADKTLGERLGEAEALSRRLSSQLGVGTEVLDRVGQVADAAVAGKAVPGINSYEAAAAELAAEQATSTVSAYDAHGTIEQTTSHQDYGYDRAPVAAAASDMAPAQASAPAPAEPRHSRAKDIFRAAQESTSRLEEFRRRAQGRVA
ncbi:DUF6468 domain-containing protein [Pseudovibrio exalbescens]|uniref:DUF6468 domain-containing protein n=1 Tax=Pseudovibrio exalbescens TaxID=197461 RepID=UPI000C9B27D5|nr:DUF6468 domain-containing protein [Pseudovibrio exalbescens]